MSKTINLHLSFMIDGQQLQAAVEVPAEPAPRRVLLPILQNLTDTIVQMARHNAPQPASCKKGCDACCRQMVPISPTEAYALAAHIDSLPPAHAAAIMARFDQACEALDALGLLDRLLHRHALTPDQQHQLDRDYFAAAIPCPFLEDHACSIHPSRPLACREFLVTSPAEFCRHPTADKVTPLPLPAKASLALAALDDHHWLPLILARTFLADHPEPTPQDPPSKILQQILESL